MTTTMTMRNFFPEKFYFSFLHGKTSVSSHDLTTRKAGWLRVLRYKLIHVLMCT
jgi:hypothetical protein